MGAVAAIVAAVGTVAAVGVSAYSASQKGGAIGPLPEKVGDVTNLKLSDPTSSFQPYLDQQKYLPALDQFTQLLSAKDNAAFQKQLSSTDPNLMGNLAKVGQNASSFLSGAIPQDVQDTVRRDSAYQALSGGYGGTTMAGNLTARDLGRTSLDLLGKGSDLANNELSLDRSVNPYNYTPQSLLYSPQQLLQRQDDQTYYNTDLANQVSFMNSGRQYASDVAANAQKNAGQNASLQNLQGLLGNSGATAKTLANGYKSLSGLWGPPSTTPSTQAIDNNVASGTATGNAGGVGVGADAASVTTQQLLADNNAYNAYLSTGDTSALDAQNFDTSLIDTQV